MSKGNLKYIPGLVVIGAGFVFGLMIDDFFIASATALGFIVLGWLIMPFDSNVL